jgi:hypothetical protein
MGEGNAVGPYGANPLSALQPCGRGRKNGA